MNQFAYRTGHSALHAVDLQWAEARENKRKGKSTAVVSMDVIKAFDLVWRKGLVHKLKANGEHNNKTAIINNFVTNRTARGAEAGKRIEIGPDPVQHILSERQGTVR